MLRFRDKHFKNPCLSNLALEDQFTPMMRVLGRFPPRSLPVPFGDLSPLTTTGPRGPALVTNLGLLTLGNFLGPRSRGCAENPARPAPPAPPARPAPPAPHSPGSPDEPHTRAPHGQHLPRPGASAASTSTCSSPGDAGSASRTSGSRSSTASAASSASFSGGSIPQPALSLQPRAVWRPQPPPGRSALPAPGAPVRVRVRPLPAPRACPPLPSRPRGASRLHSGTRVALATAGPVTVPPGQSGETAHWSFSVFQSTGRDAGFSAPAPRVLGPSAASERLCVGTGRGGTRPQSPGVWGTEACGYLWVQSQPRLHSETLFLNK